MGSGYYLVVCCSMLTCVFIVAATATDYACLFIGSAVPRALLVWNKSSLQACGVWDVVRATGELSLTLCTSWPPLQYALNL